MTIMSAILDVQYSAAPLLQPPALECLVLSNFSFDIFHVILSLQNYTPLCELSKFHELMKLFQCAKIHLFQSSKIIFVEIQSFRPGGTLCGCY